MFQNLKLRSKLILLLVLPFFIFLSTTFVAIIKMNAITDKLIQTLYTETYQATSLIQDVEKNMDNALIAQRTLIFIEPTNKKYNKILNSYSEALSEVKTNSAAIEEHILNNKKLISLENYALIDKLNIFTDKFDQWEYRSDHIIASSAPQNYRGEEKLILQGIIADEAIANDHKFEEAKTELNNIQTLLEEYSKQVIKEVETNNKKTEQSLISIVVITFIIALVFGLLLIKTIISSIQQLVNLTNRISIGNFKIDNLHINSNDEIGQLAANFVTMCHRLNDYIQVVYISKIREKEAELKALQMQINPHFLFNTLEVIKMKAFLNKDLESANMIKGLANIFRWNVKSKGAVVTLEEELAYTEEYIKIQKIRFEERLDITINIHSDLMHLAVPKLMIQPLLENAINHGFKNKMENCLIHVKAEYKDHFLCIHIHDNGEGIETVKLNELRDMLENTNDVNTTSIGLKNVHERIRLLFGENYGLHFTAKANQGLTITLNLPIKSVMEVEEDVKNINRR